MREIKYKAWDKVEKEWIDIKHFGFENGELWYVQAIDKNERDIDPPYFPDSEDIELLEYTGMNDRDGIEIFEGDILHLDGHQDMQVKFIDGCFVALSTNRIQELNWMPTALNINILLGYKVIGNIYENLELLEV